MTALYFGLTLSIGIVIGFIICVLYSRYKLRNYYNATQFHTDDSVSVSGRDAEGKSIIELVDVPAGKFLFWGYLISVHSINTYIENLSRVTTNEPHKPNVVPPTLRNELEFDSRGVHYPGPCQFIKPDDLEGSSNG